jgi:hypothetical protein
MYVAGDMGEIELFLSGNALTSVAPFGCWGYSEEIFDMNNPE